MINLLCLQQYTPLMTVCAKWQFTGSPLDSAKEQLALALEQHIYFINRA